MPAWPIILTVPVLGLGLILFLGLNYQRLRWYITAGGSLLVLLLGWPFAAALRQIAPGIGYETLDALTGYTVIGAMTLTAVWVACLAQIDRRKQHRQ